MGEEYGKRRMLKKKNRWGMGELKKKFQTLFFKPKSRILKRINLEAINHFLGRRNEIQYYCKA